MFSDAKDMESFFRYVLAEELGTYPSKSAVYVAFKDFWSDENREISDDELLAKITRMAKYYRIMYKDEPAGTYAQIISDFQHIDSKMPAPFVLGLYEFYAHDGAITEKQYFDSIQVLNSYLIRRLLSGDDTSRIARAFPSYLTTTKKFMEEFSNEEADFVEIIKYVLFDKNQGNKMASATSSTLQAAMRINNAYSGYLTKFILERIENELNPVKLNFSNLNIEHIMPQTSTLYWEQAAGVSDEEYTELVNTIGNLTLVANVDNSAAGNKDFATKKEIFNETSHIKMNQTVLRKETWTGKDIKHRSDWVSDQINSIWPYYRSSFHFDKNPERKIHLMERGIESKGYLNDDETVTIYQGSQMVAGAGNLNSDSLQDVRKELIENRVVQRQDGVWTFVKDYRASSVSRAASLLLGGARNGWDYWLDVDGFPIGETLRNTK